MVIAVPAAETDSALALLSAAGEQAWVIGQIETAQDGEEQVELRSAQV
jgi:phosphoribosylformylglycinamidine cyclo-ligase